MITIRLEEGIVCFDTASIGAALGIEVSVARAKIRGGKIASLCVRGVDKNARRHRLTFSLLSNEGIISNVRRWISVIVSSPA